MLVLPNDLAYMMHGRAALVACHGGWKHRITWLEKRP